MRSDDLRNLLASHNAKFTTHHGIDVVEHFGDPFSEKRAIEACAIADRSERETVVCSGSDVIQLMQGLVTNNVFNLATAGHGQRNIAVNINGRIVMDMRLLHVNDLILMDLEPGCIAAGKLGHFKKNVINEDAKFFDRSAGLSKFALFGARAIELLTTLINFEDSPAQLPLFHGTTGTSNDGTEVVVQRIDFGAIPAFEVMLQRDDAANFFSRAVERNAVPVGEHAQELVRVSERVSRYSVDPAQSLFGAELSDNVIPLEADLEPLIDFEKGCYLGQEIIARLDSRGTPAKRLRWFESTANREEILVDGQKVGTVVTSVPTHAGFALAAYLKRDFADIELR